MVSETNVINIQQLVETTQDYALLLLSPQGTVLYGNNTALEIFETDRTALSSALFSSLLRNADTATFLIKRVLDEGYCDDERWLITETSRRWIISKIRLIKHSGKPDVISMITLDGTEKKTLELRMKDDEERYRLLVDSVKDYAIFMVDPQGIILTWNEGAKRIKGYEEYEVKGKHFSMFYRPEDVTAGKPEDELRIAFNEGKFEAEGWRVRKNGTYFWASLVLTSIYNNHNQLIGYSKVTRDLSERKLAEESLKASEEQYRLLVNSVKDYGIFMLDAKGRIASWNAGAQRIKGYEASEVIGKYFSIFYTKEDKDDEKPQRELRIAIKEGKYEEEGWRVRKDGSRFWANVVITAVFNSENKLIGFSKVTRDLTERKKDQEALERTQTELRRANEELTRSNRELEQYTSIASHDLQEPLRTISNYLSIIEERMSGSDDKVKDYLSRTIDASERLRDLITNLLRYSRLSHTSANYSDVEMSDVFTETIHNLRTNVDETGTEVIFDNKVERLRGDKIQLVQLFQNLITNSIKFVKDRKPKIKITGVEEKDHYLFSVNDNGIGIEEEYLNKIFEIFKRLHSRMEFPGTGIGLAICKKIVEFHKGHIWVESVPGKGSTFYFTISKAL
jgi:PAS domain S-box-containing protein